MCPGLGIADIIQFGRIISDDITGMSATQSVRGWVHRGRGKGMSETQSVRGWAHSSFNRSRCKETDECLFIGFWY